MTGGCGSGVKDSFIDWRSLYDWDYYNDGMNPDKDKKYKTLLTNVTVSDNGNRIFHGDLSKERIDFLIKLSSTENPYGYTIFWEHEGYPPIWIYKGKVYGLHRWVKDSKDKPFHIRMEQTWGKHIINSKDEIPEYMRD